MDQVDPWQAVPRQVFTPYSRLLISAAFVVVSRVGCLGLTGVTGVCVGRYYLFDLHVSCVDFMQWYHSMYIFLFLLDLRAGLLQFLFMLTF